MKILACADIHMGRKPEFAQSGHSSWDAIVEKALSLAVDVVVLAGDVVEQEKAWLSVYGPLLKGLQTLKEAGIRVVGVGGNHDWNIFPSLVQDSDAITILGLGGKWESLDIGCVRFLGWSFPSSHEKENPLKKFPSDLLNPSRIHLGLLHADYGMAFSSYAPIQEHDLLHSGVDLWMLGHIHKRGRVGTDNAYYCGSPYALDVNEMGEHGMYLLETEGETHFKEPLFIPLCPYRYETCCVDVSGIHDANGIQQELSKSIRTCIQELKYEGTLYVKAVFTGTLNLSLNLGEIMQKKRDDDAFFLEEQGVVAYLLDRYEDKTELAIDLEQLSKGSGPDALLAKKLLDPVQLNRLARQYQSLNEESCNSSAYSRLDSSSLSLEEAANLARQAGMRLLQAMVVQKEGER